MATKVIPVREFDTELHEQLKLAVENSMDGIALLSAAGEYTYLNPKHVTMFGYENESELLGKTWQAIYGPAEISRIESKLFPLLMANGYWSGETIGISKDGKPVHQIIALTALPNGGLICITKDTTEQKMREAEMQMMTRMMESSNSMVMITNANQEVEWVNKAFLNLTGYTEEEVIGKKPQALLHGPDTDPLTVAYIFKQIKKGVGFETEILNYTKDKRPYWVQFNCIILFDDAGKPYRYCSFQEDITKRKEAEDKLMHTEQLMHAAIEGIDAGVYEWDLEHGKNRYSDTAYRILGYDHSDKPEGWRPFEDGTHPEDVQRVNTAVQRLLVDGSRVSEVYRIRKGNGEYTWISDHAMPVAWKNGKPSRIVGSFQDITHIKNYERDLIRKEQEINFALEASSAAIWEWDIVSDQGRLSKEFNLIIESDHLAGSREEAWVKRIHPDDLNRVQLAMKQYLSGEIPNFQIEYRVLTEKGHYKWVQSQGKVIERDLSGKPVRLVGTMMDFTERKIAEQRLIETEQRWQFALDSSASGVWDWNVQTDQVYYSAGWKAIVGYEDDALTGSLDIWVKHVYPDDLPLAMERIQDYFDGRADKYESEHRMICADGSIKWVLDRGKVISYTSTGKPWRMIGTITDIHARKEAERQLRELEQRWQYAMEGSETGVWDWYLNPGKIYLSDSWKTMLGYRPSELPNETGTWDALIHPEDREMCNAKVNLYLKGLSPIYDIVHRLRRKDGSYSWIQSRGKIVEFNADGTPRRLIGIHRNIDHFIEIQQSLKEAKEAAEISAVIKQRFLANITHELRTPMQAILGMGEQLVGTGLNEKQQQLVDIINQSSNFLLGIINDLLDITKIEDGKLKLVNRPFDLVAAVRNTYQLLSPKAEEKGLSLKLNTDTRLDGKFVMADELRLKQILLNVAGNAVKFTNKGFIELSVQVVKETDKDCLVDLVCKDSGIGMSDAMLEKLFEDFAQEDDSFVRRFGGSGLGLSITRKLVDMMGGTIHVTSEKNAGTEVRCQFNFLKAVLEQPNIEPPDIFRLQAAKLASKKILLVDDNRFNRLLAIFIMDKFGIKYDEAEDGNQAIGLLKVNTYDLILMDIQMPEKDGFEATREIRETLKLVTPILVLTAHGFQDNIEYMKELGANDAIIKPFDEKSFISKILEVLQLRDQ